MIEPMILESSRISPAQETVEIVERKGLGHPDTICDAVMEFVAGDRRREERRCPRAEAGQAPPQTAEPVPHPLCVKREA